MSDLPKVEEAKFSPVQTEECPYYIIGGGYGNRKFADSIYLFGKNALGVVDLKP